MCDRARFFGKYPHLAKMAKNGQKWPKNMVFGLFKKIMLLLLSGICVKWKFFWCLLACLGKIWFSSYSQKWFSANEISVFFNCQYFTNRVLSDFNFWDVGRHEWKKQGSLTGVLKKNLIWANGPSWALTIMHPHNSGSAERLFFKFCWMKRVNK